MSTKMTASRIKQSLTSVDVVELVKWYIETYEAGQRPAIHIPVETDARYQRLKAMYSMYLWDNN